MTRHTVMLLALVGDVALVALASVQLLAEARWRRRCARLTGPQTAATCRPKETPPNRKNRPSEDRS